MENDILAYDVDINLIEIYRERLNEVASRFSLVDVRWNLKCADFLSDPLSEQFDFIVGNPPYIAYSDLPGEVQQYEKKHFETCRNTRYVGWWYRWSEKPD